jgi:transcription elongation factor
MYIIQNTHVQIAIVQLANRTNLNQAAYTSECTSAATPNATQIAYTSECPAATPSSTTGNATPRVLFSS